MKGISRIQTLAVLALFATAFPACRADHGELGKQGDVTTDTQPSTATQPSTTVMQQDEVGSDVYADTTTSTTSGSTAVAPIPVPVAETKTKAATKSHRAAKAAVAGAAVGGAAIAAHHEPTHNEVILDDLEDDMDATELQEDDLALYDENGMTPEESYVEEDIYLTPEREPASTVAAEAQNGDKLLTRKPDLGLDYEPHSVWSKTGTLGMTGIDRSHEQLSRQEPVFVDAVLAQYQPVDYFVPLSSINFNKFTYNDRHEFQTVTNNYVDQIQGDVIDWRGEADTLKDRPAGMKESLKVISKQEDLVRSNIANAPRVKAENWINYKDNLHEQISELEKSYAEVRTSMNE